MIDPGAKFRPVVLREVKAYAASKPFRGTLAERKTKLRGLHRNLCGIYRIAFDLNLDGVTDPEREHGNGWCRGSGTGRGTIALEGKLSVITYLHEFAHAAFGGCERKAVHWSANLFRRTFPASFRRLRAEGHLLR